MEKQRPLNRTCLSCGLEKPLAAFLQISGTQGTVYGNICSTCRSTGAKSKTIVPKTDIDDEEGSESSGYRIDNKMKVQEEIERKRLDKKTKELDQLERRALEDSLNKKTDRKDAKEKGEKEHRKDIDTKKQKGFLSTQTGTKPNNQSAIDRATHQERGFIQSHQEIIENQNQESAIKEEIRNTTIDLSQEFRDPQFGESGLRFQSEIFRAFRARLGPGANINAKIRDMFIKKENKAGDSNEPIKEKDPLNEYADKNWNPSGSPKRGR